MTYTPYGASNGECKTSDVVDADIKSIADAGFSTVRVYSTDCDTLPLVGEACRKYGVKMIVGIFISEYGCSNGSPDVDTQISALKEWGQWDLVDLMAVGNEALYNGYCTAQELVNLINHVKSELTDYTGPYTTTDIVSAWEQEDISSVVCDAIDVVAANIHSYFSADVLPIDAGKFVKSQIENVEKACGGKPGYVLECGYPTAGNTNGVNVPSVLNQQIAITSIKETLGDKVVFFSMFDDEWKADGACNCEKHWGCGSLFGALGLGNGN
jgi:exo-beta-1,3-glucanase (GH17 family)